MADQRFAGERAPDASSALDDSDSQASYRVRIRDDHAAIARLAEDLLPALIAKLTSSGLGEIEVREGGWKARLRKPEGAPEAKRSAGWSQSAQGSHAGHGHAAAHSLAEGLRRPCDDEDEPEPDDKRVIASSPAVGIYHPRRDLTVGMRIRAGDKIGTVDVLGVREEVPAPVDGVIGASLVEAGEAVEYGQELVRIELPQRGPRDGERAGGVVEPVGGRGRAD